MLYSIDFYSKIKVEIKTNLLYMSKYRLNISCSCKIAFGKD